MIVLFVFYVDSISAGAELTSYLLFLPIENLRLGPENIYSLPWRTPGILSLSVSEYYVQ